MSSITISEPFKRKVIIQAQEMINQNIAEQVLIDSNKEIQGMTIFIDMKPTFSLFEFDFPEDYELGKGKKIFVGNN